ncbi:RICIN domain-containing protein [Pseudoduganella chitinolytica]|uniref:RICIN domain-containing protein n=1 Tax=Pseudoduganella chitinolytica TaxID=34070 RepID=A0ABY8BF51_9BURK|nr:RICIN domain-containing protein [Pseudoduganella chitinolytica]WEF34028.1 RICIN domain-containing protein [Pseudoduganella chitinolytica]
MPEPMQPYLIVPAGDMLSCLGARHLAAGAPLGLMPRDRDNAVPCWLFADGLIRLAGHGDLCLDVRAVHGGAGQACLGTVLAGKLSQHWQWLEQPGVIVNDLYPKLVLDSADARLTPGNPVQVRARNGAAGQDWTRQAPGTGRGD